MEEYGHETMPSDPWPEEVTRDDHPTPKEEDCKSTATSDAPVPFGYYASLADGQG